MSTRKKSVSHSTWQTVNSYVESSTCSDQVWSEGTAYMQGCTETAKNLSLSRSSVASPMGLYYCTQIVEMCAYPTTGFLLLRATLRKPALGGGSARNIHPKGIALNEVMRTSVSKNISVWRSFYFNLGQLIWRLEKPALAVALLWQGSPQSPLKLPAYWLDRTGMKRSVSRGTELQGCNRESISIVSVPSGASVEIFFALCTVVDIEKEAEKTKTKQDATQ